MNQLNKSTLSFSRKEYSDRIAAIDILRALTMVLMIFVNDLYTLKGVPKWLLHVKLGVSGIGLSDVVFPAFLFIVGLSLPFAINYRKLKNDSTLKILVHILLRTIALLTMGVFLVNVETINAQAMGMPRQFWSPLCCLAFVLIWNAYPRNFPKSIANHLKALGIVILCLLAIFYRGGSLENLKTFSPHWWGILGLIGWAYLPAALISLFSKNKFWLVLIGWLSFCFLSIAYKAHLFVLKGFLSYIPDAIIKGTLPALVMGGVLTSVIFQHFRKKNEPILMTILFLSSTAVLLGLAWYTESFWGISKLGSTPAWLFLCSALTLLAFIVVYWLVDVWQKQVFFEFIKPAGTDTLLCYLMPCFVGFLLKWVFVIRLPAYLLIGNIGLLKSFGFALLCVWLTYLLNKIGIRLKL